VRAVQQGLQLELRALVVAHAIDEQGVPLLDAVLLVADSDDCVHDKERPEGSDPCDLRNPKRLRDKGLTPPAAGWASLAGSRRPLPAAPAATAPPALRPLA